MEAVRNLKHETSMIYPAPLQNEKHYVVPVVMKNKDHLVGYIQGYRAGTDIDLESCNDSEFMDISSKRFNDVIYDGVRESQMDIIERRKLFYQNIGLVNSRLEKENEVDYQDVLRVACSCGMGFYAWKDMKDIPSVNTKCNVCGKYIIHYTNKDDWEYDFDEGEENGID